jgi:hypothetical protein
MSLRIKSIFILTLFLLLAPIIVFAESASLLKSGKTSISFSTEFTRLLSDSGVQLIIVAPGKLQNGTASFIVSGGVIDVEAAKGEISHLGSIQLDSGANRVEIVSLMISQAVEGANITGMLTGVVIINDRLIGRVPLFKMEIGSIEARASGRITIPNVRVSLSSEGASALNRAFNTDNFTEGSAVGTAQIQARGERFKN